MAESLRDLLLKSGIVQQVRDEKRANMPQGGKSNPAQARPPRKEPSPQRKHGDGHGKSAQDHAGKSQQEIDLAKAYALRAQTEASERKRAEQAAAEQARLKRERKAKIQQLLEGSVLNLAEAEHVRHFEYGGKIRRVHVDANQLQALNAGELGVVQQAGRYLLVRRDIAEQIRTIDAQQLALLVEPGVAGGVGEDGVPDDLIW